MNTDKIKEIFDCVETKADKIIVKKDFLNVIDLIKNNYKFDMLKEIIAIDNKDCIELIYNLYSTENDEDLKLSLTVSNNEAESVSKMYDSAVADEKEIYDLFGIKFIGNDELKRLYMPENWQGHPLRKDYSENDKRLEWNE